MITFRQSVVAVMWTTIAVAQAVATQHTSPANPALVLTPNDVLAGDAKIAYDRHTACLEKAKAESERIITRQDPQMVSAPNSEERRALARRTFDRMNNDCIENAHRDYKRAVEEHRDLKGQMEHGENTH